MKNQRKKLTKKAGAVSVCLQYLHGSKRYFVLTVVFSMLTTVFSTVVFQILRVGTDALTGEQSATLPAFVTDFIADLLAREGVGRLLIFCAAGMLLCAGLMGLADYFYHVTCARGAEGFGKSLRDGLFSHLQRLPMTYHSQNRTGDLIQRCTSDVEVVRSFVANQLTELFRIVFLIIFWLTVMFTMSVPVSLIVTAFIPVVVAYSMVYYGAISSRFRKADEVEGALTATVQENLTGVRVVRAFGRERQEVDRFDAKNNEFHNLWIRLGQTMSLFWGTGDFFSGLQTVLVLVVGTYLTATGQITLGTLVAFISYNGLLVWPIRQLGRIISEMSKSGVSFERIAHILSAQEEDYAGTRTPALQQDIRFEGVSFAFGEAPVLEDISFTLPQGKTLGILGATGAGKSTVAALLLRLYDPSGGRILIGDTDIKDVPLAHLRRNIALISQEPFLFSRTLEKNIAAARPDATLEQVRAAAKVAHIDKEIMEFEQGYETMVGERGVTLSGGQKQRVSIARALLTEAPVLIFDDSLSAVDAGTDADIRKALKGRTAGQTCIIISHRINTLRASDAIAVIENGRISEYGTHDQLLEREGVYRNIYEIQKG